MYCLFGFAHINYQKYLAYRNIRCYEAFGALMASGRTPSKSANAFLSRTRTFDYHFLNFGYTTD
jgi:hypothetical protein